MSTGLSELTQVKSFNPVHSLGRFGRTSVLGEFIATREGAEIIESVFESLTGVRLSETEARRRDSLSFQQIRRSHLVRANFGTGKTITLLALSEMLTALGNPERFAAWRDQFENFPTLQTQYDMLLAKSQGRPYLCLMLDMKEKGSVPFRDVVVQSLYEWLKDHRPELTLNSEFTSAAEQMDNAATRMPERLQIALERQAPGLTVEELRQDLLSWDRSKLSLAYAVMEEAAGFPPTPYRVEMRTFYDDAREILNREFGGIAIVLDELHHFFTTGASFGTLPVSLADFDAFAVYVNETKSEELMPCVLVGAVHENLGSYFKDSGTSGDAFHQAVGRFNEYPLTSSISQMELIAGAFVQKNGGLSTLLTNNPTLAVHVKLIQSRSESDADWLRCFPLHPAVVTYLPLLSRRLAQSDRTTFHFLDTRVRHWVSDSSAVVDGRLQLVLLPEVYTYFQKAVEDRHPAVVRAVNGAVSYCGGGLLHRQVMETLACLHIASTVSTTEGNFQVRSGAPSQSLASYLNFPPEEELDQVLRDLTSSGYVHLSDRDEFFLVATGGISNVELDRRVASMSASIDPNSYLKERLRADWRVRGRTIFLSSHTYKDRVSRSFSVQLLSAEELKAFSEAPGSGYSGTILFVVPRLKSDHPTLRKDVEAELPRLQALGAVVALPLQWDGIKPDDIRRQEALRQLKNSATTEEQKQTIDARLVEEETKVTNRLVEFGQPSNWLFCSSFGELRSNRRTLSDVLEVIVRGLYPKFPEFKAGHLQTNTLIHGLLDRFLPNPVNLRCDVTTKGRVEAILATVGLATSSLEDQAAYSLTAPSNATIHPNSISVWHRLESMDLTSKTVLADLYRCLTAPPYGLLNHMVELYLGIFTRVKGLAVYRKRSGEYVQDLQSRILKEITQAKDEGFRLEPPANTDADTLKRLAEIWALLSRATGSQSYLTASDPATSDATKRKLLAQDVQASCSLFEQRLIIPMREIGQPHAAGETLIQALKTAVSSLDGPAGETLQLVAATGVSDTLESMLQEVEAHGNKLAPLVVNLKSFRALSAPSVDQYPDLAAAYADAMAQANALEVSKPESCERLATALDAFQMLFLAEYSAEHDQLQQAREGFGRRVLALPAFSLLRGLGQISVPTKGPNFPRASTIEAEVLSEQKSACGIRGSAAMLKGGGYACSTCPDGGYRLGTVVELERTLRSREEQLQVEVAHTVSAYLDWLEKLDTPAYAQKELGLPAPLNTFLYGHDKQSVASLALLKMSLREAIESPGGTGNDAQDHLKQLLGTLNSYLAKAAGNKTGPKRVRLTLHEVANRAETLLAEGGLDVISLDPATAVERRKTILEAVERALTADPGSILEIVLRRKNVG